MPAIHVADTNMLVLKKPCGPNTSPYASNANPSGPNTKRCEPNTSPDAIQWNMVRVGYARVGFVLGMSLSCCLCQFHLRWVVKANTFSGGIIMGFILLLLHNA